MLRMSSRGLASSSTRSASLPGSTTQGIEHLQGACGIEGGGLQGLQRREASFDQPLELHVKADAGNPQRHPNVRPSQQQDSGLVQETNVLQLERDDRPKD